MSKILLTSTGLSNKKVRDKFIEVIGESRGAVAIITTASEEKESNKYCQLALTQLKEIGFNTVDFVDLETEPNKDFSNYDVIYVSGGTTFRLLKFVKQSNFQQAVQALFNRGGVYIGVSAGSYIMCPTIEMSTWKRADVDRYGLVDLTALNFVPFLLSVHYEPKHKESIEQGVAQTKHHKAEVLGRGYALYETRPRYDDPTAPWTKCPVVKITYHKASDSWLLYWCRASGQWLKYKQCDSFDEALQVIKQDKDGCFWG